jgi:hypothetical protein
MSHEVALPNLVRRGLHRLARRETFRQRQAAIPWFVQIRGIRVWRRNRGGPEAVWHWSGGGLTWVAQGSYIERLTTLAMWLGERLCAPCIGGEGTAHPRRVPDVGCVRHWNRLIYAISSGPALFLVEWGDGLGAELRLEGNVYCTTCPCSIQAPTGAACYEVNARPRRCLRCSSPCRS